MTEILLAVYLADERVLRLLILESRIFEKKQSRMSVASPLVMKAMETAVNAHRRGGCTSGQLQEIEAAIAKLEELAA